MDVCFKKTVPYQSLFKKMIDVPVRKSSDIAAQKTKCSLQLVKSHHCKGIDFLRKFYLNFYFFYKGSAVGSSKE